MVGLRHGHGAAHPSKSTARSSTARASGDHARLRPRRFSHGHADGRRHHPQGRADARQLLSRYLISARSSSLQLAARRGQSRRGAGTVEEGAPKAFDAVFGIHCRRAPADVGHVATRPAPARAAADKFEIVIRYLAGNAARPQSTASTRLQPSALVNQRGAAGSSAGAPTRPSNGVVTIGNASTWRCNRSTTSVP